MANTLLFVIAIALPVLVSSQCCAWKWSEWTTTEDQCPDYCGGCGTYTKNRTCLTTDCLCPGEASETLPCDTEPCSFPRKKTCCPGKNLTLSNTQLVCSSNEITLTPAAATCTMDCCPEQGIWSEWTYSSLCNGTCGGCGMVPRTRTCLTQDQGCPCSGASSDMASCQFNPCTTGAVCCDGFFMGVDAVSGSYQCKPFERTPQVNTTTCCLPGGLWNTWSMWSSCSASCGLCGKKTRVRTCASLPYGCPCQGSDIEEQACNGIPCNGTTPCCSPNTLTTGYDGISICSRRTEFPVGTWSEWAAVEGSTCNDTCGYCGSEQKQRFCLPAGSQCVGEFTADKPCAPIPCAFPRKTCCDGYVKSANMDLRIFVCVANTTIEA